MPRRDCRPRTGRASKGLRGGARALHLGTSRVAVAGTARWPPPLPAKTAEARSTPARVRRSCAPLSIDVAREAGVSAATVDRVLNNRAGGARRAPATSCSRPRSGSATSPSSTLAQQCRAAPARRWRGSISCCLRAPTPSSRCCTGRSSGRRCRVPISTSMSPPSKASTPTGWPGCCRTCTAAPRASA